MYPEYKDIFETINKKTYDLMTIFSQLLYFDRRFEGSASIKKVLPVLTDITYDDLAISNGSDASNELFALARGNLHGETLKKTKQNLLEYCKQDTRAMVAIWQQLQKSLSHHH